MSKAAGARENQCLGRLEQDPFHITVRFKGDHFFEFHAVLVLVVSFPEKLFWRPML